MENQTWKSDETIWNKNNRIARRHFIGIHIQVNPSVAVEVETKIIQGKPEIGNSPILTNTVYEF